MPTPRPANAKARRSRHPAPECAKPGSGSTGTGTYAACRPQKAILKTSRAISCQPITSRTARLRLGGRLPESGRAAAEEDTSSSGDSSGDEFEQIQMDEQEQTITANARAGNLNGCVSPPRRCVHRVASRR